LKRIKETYKAFKAAAATWVPAAAGAKPDAARAPNTASAAQVRAARQPLSPVSWCTWHVADRM
jgi:hypothetical protein